MKKMKPPIRRSGSRPVSSRPSHEVSGSGSAVKMSALSVWPPLAAASFMSLKTSVRMPGTTTV